MLLMGFGLDQGPPPAGGQGKEHVHLEFSLRPAVPVYCRWPPAEDRPFLTQPVSSTINTASSMSRSSAA
jgi:hypothetical protein